MEKKSKASYRRLGPAEKMDVVREYHLERQTQRAIAQKHGVSPCYIFNILRTFANENKGSGLLMKDDVKSSKSEEIKALRREIAELKKQLYNEQMRADFYETMVDVADEMFHTDIRKKAGISQPEGCTKESGDTR